MTADTAICIMVDRIAELFKPERIILFGSQAQGTAGMESDIDLLVVFDKCSDKRSTTVSIMKALSDVSVSKDIIVATSDELSARGELQSTILYSALNEGKILYSR